MKSELKLKLTLNSAQIREAFKSVGHRAQYGTFLRKVKETFREKGLFQEMLEDAYGWGLDSDTLKELLEAKPTWFQLDHVWAPLMDDPNNFCARAGVKGPSIFQDPRSPLHAIDATFPRGFVPTDQSRAPRSS